MSTLLTIGIPHPRGHTHNRARGAAPLRTDRRPVALLLAWLARYTLTYGDRIGQTAAAMPAQMATSRTNPAALALSQPAAATTSTGSHDAVTMRSRGSDHHEVVSEMIHHNQNVHKPREIGDVAKLGPSAPSRPHPHSSLPLLEGLCTSPGTPCRSHIQPGHQVRW